MTNDNESKKKVDTEESTYNPFENRNVKHQTTDVETFIHFMKGSMGSGILAVPYGVKNAGLWFGLGCTLCIGFICGYCIHMIVKCSHTLCIRRQIPSMTFAEIVENTFLDGPPKIQRYARAMRITIDAFLVIDLMGCCCIYLVFFASNMKQVIEFHTDYNINVRLWILIFTIPMMFMCLVRNLKYLTSFSLIANIMICIGIVITCTYIFIDIPSPQERESIANFRNWPLFFGTIIFAMECIGVVMPLENDMKHPQRFTGCPSVLCFAFIAVISLYVVLGFFGYLKYGDDTEGSITLNLPIQNPAAQFTKIVIGLAIYFTFTLQFYVSFNIIWRAVKHNLPEEHLNVLEYALRMICVIICGAIAAALPNLGPFISLIGALCLSIIGLIIPPVCDLIVYYEDPGYGLFYWRAFKNAFIIIFGIVGLFTGTYVSVLEFIEGYYLTQKMLYVE